jgi:hypothetical protein
MGKKEVMIISYAVVSRLSRPNLVQTNFREVGRQTFSDRKHTALVRYLTRRLGPDGPFTLVATRWQL